MRLCLIYPSWTSSYGSLVRYFARRNSTWPPHNLCLLAACVQKHGHEVDIIDGEAEHLSREKVAARIMAGDYDVVGFTATTPFYHVVRSCAACVRLAGFRGKMILGGPHATIMEGSLFVDGWSHIFLGNAELSLPRFLDAPASYPGLITQDEVVGKDYQLDDLPVQAVEKLHLDRYRLGTLQGRKRFVVVQAMRGCPWACVFCASDKLSTTRLAQRSPVSVVDEMEYIVSLGTTHFMFADDVLTLYPKRILGICQLLLDRNITVTFEGSTRANLVDDRILDRMVAAGLTRLSFGLESADEGIRETMKKKVPIEYYERANSLCEKYGIEVMNSFMLGLPGETRQTAMKTLNYVAGMRSVKQANMSIATPYPGTEFHTMAFSGVGGVRVVNTDEDFANYKRYGSTVIEVNDLSQRDLLELQNLGFLKIYSKSWRWIPMYRKHGIVGFMLMILRLVRALSYVWRHKSWSGPG